MGRGAGNIRQLETGSSQAPVRAQTREMEPKVSVGQSLLATRPARVRSKPSSGSQ